MNNEELLEWLGLSTWHETTAYLSMMVDLPSLSR